MTKFAQLIVGALMIMGALAFWVFGPTLDENQSTALVIVAGLGALSFFAGLDD